MAKLCRWTKASCFGSHEDESYVRMLSQKFTTDCSAQNLAGPVLFEINAQ